MQTLLVTTYDRSGGRPSALVFPTSFAAELGWTERESVDVAEDLVERGLAEFKTTGPSIGLTIGGFAEAEELVLESGSEAQRALVRRRQLARLKMLKFAYERSEGRTDEPFNFREAASATGLDETELAGVAEWLVERGFLRWYAIGGSIRLTADGIDEVERAEQDPDEPAGPGLAAYNVLVISNSPGAVVQQGTVASTLTVEYEPSTLLRIRGWLESFEQHLDEFQASADQMAEVAAALASAKAHAALDRPKSGILRASLEELRAFLLAAAASGVGQAAAMALLGQWPGSAR